MNKNVDTFLKVLDAADSSVGGGAASALSGAMAGALVALVARLSIGKDGMKEQSYYQKVISEAEMLSSDLYCGGHEDELAFAAIRNAYRLPKDTVEARIARKQAIQAAIGDAARVPLRNAGSCCRVLELADNLAECFNRNAASDLECACHLARAGALGCVANVLANTASIEDADIAARLSGEADRLKRLAE